MPQKNMGPTEFRRLLPTIIFQKELRMEGKSMQDVLSDYANLINTSVVVDYFLLHSFVLGFGEELYSIQSY